MTDVDADAVLAAAVERGINLRRIDARTVSIACDDTTTQSHLDAVLAAFDIQPPPTPADSNPPAFPPFAQRTSDYLTHEVFHRYHTEHEFLRYATRLCERDLSLCDAMIPLGSCTMKLNAAAEMEPITWPEFAEMHPFCPPDQAAGYLQLLDDLKRWIAAMTGFAAVSLQPNAGSQGEYAGLLAIARFHEQASSTHRDVCLIPTSAHGTNPASAVIAGMRVVPVACRDNGDIDLADLRSKAEQHADTLAAMMITYPSTHGVFETTVRDACALVHEHGGLVYLDGANLNAQLGLTSPAAVGADVCHLNLHKTFCIPHGGGGPGMGPIACTAAVGTLSAR